MNYYSAYAPHKPDAVWFEKWTPTVINWEGGWSDHPADAGGKTNGGITLLTWDSYAPKVLGISGGENTLRSLTKEQWAKVAWAYWNDAHVPEIISPAIKVMFMDIAWGSGSGMANFAIQKALNDIKIKVSIDGGWGNETRSAINDGYTDLSLLAYSLLKRRYEIFYNYIDSKNNQIVFLQGWLNRSWDIYKNLVGTKFPFAVPEKQNFKNSYLQLRESVPNIYTPFQNVPDVPKRFTELAIKYGLIKGGGTPGAPSTPDVPMFPNVPSAPNLPSDTLKKKMIKPIIIAAIVGVSFLVLKLSK